MKMSSDFTLQVLPYSDATAAANMAIDEGMIMDGDPAILKLRCYGWSQSAWTFGYSQRWQEVAAAKPSDIAAAVRRPTGGGIVDHRQDFTYALAISPSHPWWRESACEVYKYLHLALAHALQNCGLATRQQPCERDNCQAQRPSEETKAKACFAAPETSDLVHPETGQKWAGAALKRSRSGLLIQGSLQPSPIPNSNWKSALRGQLPGAFATALGIARIQHAPQSPIPDPAIEQKYASPAWNQKR